MNNWKVSYKLGIGFLAVLLLTVAIAALGIHSLDTVIDRSDKSQTANLLLAEANKVRQAQMRFDLTGDPQQIQQLSASSGKLQDIVQREKNRFAQADDVQHLESIVDQVRQYEQNALLLSQARQQKADTRKSWVDVGNRIDATLTDFESRYGGTPDKPVVPADEQAAGTLLQAIDAAKQNRQFRYVMRGYLMEQNDKAKQVVDQQYERTVASVKALASRLSGADAETANGLVDLLGQYMAFVNKLPPIITAENQAHEQLAKDFDALEGNTQAVVESQTAQRASEAHSKTLLMLAITALAIVVGVLISWLIVRQITLPLQQAVGIAEAIGAGDMTGELTQNRGDEFGQLLGALQRTRSNLRNVLGNVSGITTQLAAAAEQLSAVTEQTSAGVNSQKHETDQVATAMNQMTATVHEVAQNAEEAAGAARQADQQAGHGNEVVNRAMGQIERLSSELNLSAEAMDRLNEESASISTVLTVISGIAEQTNLLALNAAIEAARAGEAGRGFAVVADEVRGLAQRTQQSTAQIEALISSLQKGSQDATQIMASSRTLANETVTLARDVGEALQAITRTVSTIQGMNQQIATAAEEQTSVAEEINRSVLNVRDIADQSAAAAEETAASSGELARLGNELQALVGRFRL